MALREHRLVFLDAKGEPLPDWLQKPLRRQIGRLRADFPALRDEAVLHSLLDKLGQRVAKQAESGQEIKNVIAYVDLSAANAARAYLTQADGFNRTTQSLEGLELDAPMMLPDVDLANGFAEALSQEEEEILMEVFWSGKRHKEIAKARKMNEATVRSKYARALRKLRRRLIGAIK